VEAFIARSNAQLRRYPFSPRIVIPEGVSLSGILCRQVLGGPRSALRYGGDDRGVSASTDKNLSHPHQPSHNL